MAKFQEPKTGDLRNHVYVQQMTKTPDGAGGNTVAWVDVADPWVRVTAWKGTEPYTQNQENTSQFWEMTMRYRPGVTADMRINDKALGVVYNIRSVQDPDRRRRWLYMIVESLKQSA